MTYSPVQWHLTPSEEASVVVAQVSAGFSTWYEPTRKPTPIFRKALGHVLTVLCLNLIDVVLNDGASLVVSMRKCWYAQNKILTGPEASLRAVEICTGFLTEAGYARLVRGNPSRSPAFRKCSRLLPTAKLRAEVQRHNLGVADVIASSANPVRLKSSKDKEGRRYLLPVPPSGQVLLMVDSVECLNESIGSHWIDLELTSEQTTTMREGVALKAQRTGQSKVIADASSLHFSQRRLYRVFNNGSFDEGGRFYGGWWQNVPRDYRPFITIDGQPTVELDYSSLHPTILYNRLGLIKPSDPYLIPGLDRDLVKITFNALINAKGLKINRPPEYDASKNDRPWPDVLDAVRTHFGELSQFFGKGIGLTLQRLDSDIAEEVMVEFAARGIPILPIHDSFVIQRKFKEELTEIMQLRFSYLAGGAVGVKALTEAPNQRCPLCDDSMIDGASHLNHLNPSGPFGSHDSRVLEWLHRRADSPSRPRLQSPLLYSLMYREVQYEA